MYHFRFQFFITICFACYVAAFSQTAEEIKNAPTIYLWGQGVGKTLQEADQNALTDLIGQISTHVESQSSLWYDEQARESSVSWKSVVHTYSHATLHNTQRLVLSEEPEIKILRYIRREEVAKVFEQRHNKIKELLYAAEEAEEDLRIADALRCYYWGLMLVKSHPQGNTLSWEDSRQRKRLLYILLPERMNALFSNLKLTVTSRKLEDKTQKIFLSVLYKKQPVSQLEYSYWTGKEWTSPTTAKDGQGFVYFSGVETSLASLRLRIEYEFKAQTAYDQELKAVINQIPAVPFNKSQIELDFTPQEEEVDATVDQSSDSAPHQQITVPLVASGTNAKSTHSSAAVASSNEMALQQIVEAIQESDTEKSIPHLTASGKAAYQKLIAYGNAKILPFQKKIAFSTLNGKTYARSIPMSFAYPKKSFVENVVFHFNDDGKVDNITFALPRKTVSEIREQEMWSDTDKMMLIHFLEDYQTAYALKRLGYISSVFSDDALIITGMYLAPQKQKDSYHSNPLIKYNRLKKKEFLKRLERTFATKEYINLHFEDVTIRRSGSKESVYGVQLKQNYYSSNYGDQGYLFLLIDLKDKQEPIIHVRTWQPNKNKEGQIFGLEHF